MRISDWSSDVCSSDLAGFDFKKMKRAARLAVRMLDNVLIATKWPLQEQQREADAKRRLGLGFTGLGNTLIMMGVRYDSEQGRQIGRAHVCTPVTNAHLVCRLLLEKKKHNIR